MKKSFLKKSEGKAKKLIPLFILLAAISSAIIYFEVVKRYGNESGKIEGSGTIEATEIIISTKIAGRVIAVSKQEGEFLEKGELIARLDYDELSAQKSSMAANLDYARKNLARVKDLFSSGSVSRKELDNAETAFNVAKANFDRINSSIENALIYSPVSGTVLERNIEPGETAFPGSPIVTVADLKKPWIKIYVSEKNLGFVKIGQETRLFIDSYPDKPFRGKVISISNRAEFTPKTIQTKDERIKLMYAVKIILENSSLALKPGMPADAEIITGTGK